VYFTYDALAPNEDVLRLAFQPSSVTADGKPLPQRQELSQNGFTVKPLPGGDCLMTIRHDGCHSVVVEGDDPQKTVGGDRLEYTGAWWTEHVFKTPDIRSTPWPGARATVAFEGNQVRLIGRPSPDGGKADVYLDGVKQLCGIDFWCPQSNRNAQVLWYKNGLAPGKHRLEVVALGTKNPCSSGNRVYISGAQWSVAQGESGFGEGGGPGDTQRIIFGYLGRKDYVDSAGCAWRPATEFTLRLKPLADLVPLAFWSEPRGKDAAGTPDPELYRYGVHGRDFTAYFTVLPTQTYHVRLKFCQTEQPAKPGGYATSIDVLGEHAVSDMDIAATAGGLGKAVDLVLNDIRPKNGVISIRLWNRFSGEAMIQAIEVGPGASPAGAKPAQLHLPAAKGR
jgi:hypothetical protein